MSYIKNQSGISITNSINEENTKYCVQDEYDYNNTGTYNARYENPMPTPSDQYMYNNEPISNIDTEYNNDYRQRLEMLRTRTESMNMALESALVPSIIDGHFLQEKNAYVFNDHQVFIQTLPQYKNEPNEYYDEIIKVYDDKTIEVVFRCDMIKFYIDKNMRIPFDRHFHIYSQPGDTKIIIYKRLQDKFNINVPPTQLNYYNKILQQYKNDEELDAGIDIDTGLEMTLETMYNMGLIQAFIPMVNEYSINWSNVSISIDNKDVFLIINIKPLLDTYEDLQEKARNYELEFTYLDIPFKIKYHEGKQNNSNIPIFYFLQHDGLILPDKEYKSNMSENDLITIYSDDKYIIYEEFDMDENAFNNLSTSKFGALYNKKFTDMDYRYKIKRFNMLCFENGKIKDDFSVESHQFNILKITLDKILNDPRRFKIFYNTRVAYDQDNVLRIKNRQFILDEFTKYMEDVVENIQIFVDEIYRLYKMDWQLEYGEDYIIDENSDNWGKLSPNLKIGLFTRQLNNMEEGATPADEFIYYTNIQTANLFNEIAKQIFRKDSIEVINTVQDLIVHSFLPELVSSTPEKSQSIFEQNDFVVNEWNLRKNIAEMFKYDISQDYYIDDMSLIDEVFDFTYKDTVSYEENLKYGLDYVLSYDADKLEAGIKRGVSSIIRTGKEIKQNIDENGILTMSRWNMTKNDNYVMIFQDGTLYPYYNKIQYNDTTFSVPVEENIDDNSIFEFVFFLNCNNNVYTCNSEKKTVPLQYNRFSKNNTYNIGVQDTKTFNRLIELNTDLIDPEDLLVYSDYIPSEPDTHTITTNGSYLIDYDLYSYSAIKKGIHGGNAGEINQYLRKDFKINNMYRVTKQGGGEYFAYPCFYGQNSKLIEDRAFMNTNGITLHFDNLNESEVYRSVSSSDYVLNEPTELWYRINLDKDWARGICAYRVTDSPFSIACKDSGNSYPIYNGGVD